MTPRPITYWHHPIIGRRKPKSTRAILRRWRDILSTTSGSAWSPVPREIMLTVAGANSCRQCSFAHREWARAVGVSKAEIAALEGMDASAFSERKWTAIVWAQAAARSDFPPCRRPSTPTGRVEARRIELVARPCTG
jgi:AhpD family alkylhydroperoxidase